MLRSFMFRRSLTCGDQRSVDGRIQTRGRRRLVAAAVEALEGRALLSAFSVLNLANGGEGSLRQAILEANAQPGADTIGFADGLTGTIVLNGQLDITDHLTIDGPGAPLLAVSGNHQSRVFSISGGVTVKIAGLTIRDGKAVGATGVRAFGGGILNTGSTLVLERDVLTENQVLGTAFTGMGAGARGGGVANVSSPIRAGDLTITDCVFDGNQVLGAAGGTGQAIGAGILNEGGHLAVSRSAFLDNQAVAGPAAPARGGGIDNAMGATATITDSTFAANQAIAGDGSGNIGFGRGGGIYNNLSTLTVEGSTFLANVARGASGITGSGVLVSLAAGGGIMNADAGHLFMRGSTFTGNLALGGSNNTSTGGNSDVGDAVGGGLFNVGDATITDSLFEANEARGGSGNRGGGVGFQLVGSAMGGGIATNPGNTSGEHGSLELHNVTLRGNRAIGGDGNAAGTFMGEGIGGGLASNACNPFLRSGGSTTTLRDCTVAQNQAIGGRGRAGLGGGVANFLGGVVNISGGEFDHNLARGGDGGTAGDGGDGLGGGIYNGPASNYPTNPGAPTVLTLDGTTIAHDKAEGGSAQADGSSAGDGLGGGLWNGDSAIVRDSSLTCNMALGGDGEGGAGGGDGLGGGAYNRAAASLQLQRSSVTQNHANGGDTGIGGGEGQGIGGGVYNLGLFDFDEFTVIRKNHASTSDDDIFGSDD